MTSRDLKRLADAVIALRTELGLSQEAFAERAGTGQDRMSVKTLQRVEAAAVEPRPKTLGAIDRAAGWPAGRARALLEGEEMIEATTAPAESIPEPMPEDYPDEHEYMTAVYWYLRQWMSDDAVMRGFRMAAAIYERKKKTERNDSKAPSNKVG